MNSDPFPTSSHPPQGGIILFGKDLLTVYTICITLLINFDVDAFIFLKIERMRALPCGFVGR
jgi:hypothetical protein